MFSSAEGIQIEQLRKSGWTDEDFQVLRLKGFDSSALSPSDPALGQAQKRLDEIRQIQRQLNKQKNLLSKETKQLLKLYPSLRK